MYDPVSFLIASLIFLYYLIIVIHISYSYIKINRDVEKLISIEVESEISVSKYLRS